MRNAGVRSAGSKHAGLRVAATPAARRGSPKVIPARRGGPTEAERLPRPRPEGVGKRVGLRGSRSGANIRRPRGGVGGPLGRVSG